MLDVRPMRAEYERVVDALGERTRGEPIEGAPR